jgi:hypothetical protein
VGRPDDWSPLASADPFPGDPDAVESGGTDFENTAELISDMADQLRSLTSTDEWDACAADAFREHAVETADTIVKAKDRYATVGAELKSWARVLDRAQRRSVTILELAKDAEQTMSNNSGSLIAGVDEPTDAQIEADEARQTRYDDAADHLADYRNRLDRLRDDVDGDAERISKNIKDACKDDVKDSRWDRFKGWISDNAGWISAFADIMGWIAAIAGTLALILAMTGILAPLAAVLTVIALVATALSLVANVALALAGEGSWWAVAFDLIGLLTFGLGRVFIGAAKLGHLATQGRAIQVVADFAETTFRNANRMKFMASNVLSNVGGRVGTFVSRFSARFGTTISNLASKPLNRLNTRMNESVGAAVQRVMQMRADPRLTEGVRFLDRDLAGYAKRAQALANSYGHLPGGQGIIDAARLTQINANIATGFIGIGQISTVAERFTFASNPVSSFQTVTSPISPWW